MDKKRSLNRTKVKKRGYLPPTTAKTSTDAPPLVRALTDWSGESAPVTWAFERDASNSGQFTRNGKPSGVSVLTKENLSATMLARCAEIADALTKMRIG